jgi:hypothetical protein
VIFRAGKARFVASRNVHAAPRLAGRPGDGGNYFRGEDSKFVYPGNSRGPVYSTYSNRVFKGHMHLGMSNQGILGLVIQETHSAIPQFADKPLNYGIVVPAPFIRETIDMLPEPPDEATGSIK